MNIHLSLILILSIFLSSLLACPLFAGDAPTEFRVKANYLLSIPMFAEWSASTEHCFTFAVCLIGDSGLRQPLEAIKNRRIKNRDVEVRSINSINELECCQVLFIGTSEKYRLQTLLTEAHRRHIMTISDIRDFTRAGGMVSLVQANNRIGYQLNLSAARGASISFSSQLMKLANDLSY